MEQSLPELPTLSPGIQLLETEVRGAVPALVADTILMDSGHAIWADANGHAQTRSLAQIAPSDRILRRIRVARGFTAYQHYAIVEALRDQVAASKADLSLIVAPAVDALYRDDGLRAEEAREMFARVVAGLAGIARDVECPVLVTRTRDDELAGPVERAASAVLECEQTGMGPRFTGRDFETLVYPVGDDLVQTTFAFWKRVLQRRATGEGVAIDGDGPVAGPGVDTAVR